MSPQNGLPTAVYLIISVLSLIFCAYDTNGEVRNMIFRKIDGYRVQNIFKTTSSRTKIRCCSQCAGESGCVSVNYRKDSIHLNCDLNFKSPLDADTSIERSDNWSVLYMDIDPWKLVFRVTAGRTTDPYYAWLNGTGTDNSDDCMMLYPPSCTTYYRHNLLDEWQNWSINQMKLVLYENHTLVAYIIFNGTGSDMQSWFSKDRVIQTSWTDLATSVQAFFSLQGDDYLGRHFFIHGPYTSCAVDYGWILINSGIRPFCPFDQHGSYPSIIYARNGIKSTYGSQGYGEADVLAVYINEN